MYLMFKEDLALNNPQELIRQQQPNQILVLNCNTWCHSTASKSALSILKILPTNLVDKCVWEYVNTRFGIV